jgi:hypothetical protein
MVLGVGHDHALAQFGDQRVAFFIVDPDKGGTAGIGPATALEFAAAGTDLAINCSTTRENPSVRPSQLSSHRRLAGYRIGQAVTMQVTAGPDGFVATSNIAEYPSHVLLTEYLNERRAIGGEALERALPRFRKRLSKHELVALILTIHERIGRIAEHERELSEPRQWQDFLAQLARNLYSASLPFSANDLIAMLQGHRKHRALWSFGPEELLVAYVETHDLSPVLAAELSNFQAELTGLPGGMKYQNQAGYQVAVQHVHMLLWHDESDPLDFSRCWSEAVRRDLRAMSGARRAHWKALFRHIKGNAPASRPRVGSRRRKSGWHKSVLPISPTTSAPGSLPSGVVSRSPSVSRATTFCAAFFGTPR